MSDETEVGFSVGFPEPDPWSHWRVIEKLDTDGHYKLINTETNQTGVMHLCHIKINGKWHDPREFYEIQVGDLVDGCPWGQLPEPK
jgi:hypothetical protein